MKNGLEDYYVIRGNKKMRFGYTTGSCAAAACKGAAKILLGGVMQKAVTLMTPKGILLTLELKDIRIEGNQVTCAIQKDAGDDPDTTNGILVYATVQKTKEQHPFQSAAQNYACLRVLNKRLKAVETLVNLGERGRIAPADEARRGKCGARNGRNQTLLKEQLREVLGLSLIHI